MTPDNAIKCSACNGDHSIRSCPRSHISNTSCQTIEEHLISTIINPEVEQIAETEVEHNEDEEASIHQLQLSLILQVHRIFISLS